MWSILMLLIIALCLGLASWLIFIWAAKSGQFEDPEAPKYKILEDEED